MKKLCPMPVDWGIHPLYADFRVNATKELLTLTLDVEFVCKESIRGKFSDEEINERLLTNSLYLEEDYEDYFYQRLDVFFKDYDVFRFKYESIDFGVLNQYEVCTLMLDYLKLVTGQSYAKEIKKITEQTGFHPDPLFYLVDDSDWLTDEQKGKGYNHYLLVNKEVYVEVIGKDVDWSSKGSIYQF